MTFSSHPPERQPGNSVLKAYLINPNWGRPSLELVQPDLLHRGETSLRHLRLKPQPRIVRQQHLATVGRVADLYGHLEPRPTEDSVLSQQVQPACPASLAQSIVPRGEAEVIEQPPSKT